MLKFPLTYVQSTGHRADSRASHGLLVAGYWLLGIWAAAVAITTATSYLNMAGNFDYVEGVALGHQLMLASGQPLYGTASLQPPYSIPLYGPLFYWVNSLMLDPAALSFTAARTLNLLATVLLCLLAVNVARHRLATGAGVAWLAVLLWLTLEPAASFLLQNRPDTLALLFGASGFMAATGRRQYALPCAALLLIAAGCTKQTAMVAPLLAALLVLLTTQRRRDAGKLLLVTAGFGLSVLLLLITLTGGSYWDSAVVANLNGFSPGSALQAWSKAGRQPLFWLALGIMLFNLRTPGYRRTISIYGLTSLAVHGLAVAKPGANSNYFLEYSWCATLALAPLLDDLLRPNDGRRHALLTVLVLLAGVHTLVLATQSLERLRTTAAAWPAHAEWLDYWQTAAGGPVASMRPGTQLLLGHAPHVLDPHIIARLTEQGHFDESGLIEDLRSGSIGAVIAADDLTAGPGEFSNWSTGVRAAVARYYEKVDSLGYLSVWLPRAPGSNAVGTEKKLPASGLEGHSHTAK